MKKKKINILMLLMNESIGGTATYLLTLIKHIDQNRFNIQIVCNNDEFCNLFKMEGITAHRLEKAGRGRYLKAIRCITNLIRENDIDILNIHDGGAVSFIGRIAALITGKITISTIHIYAGEWGKRRLWFVLKEKFFEYITRSLVKKYIAVSNARKEELIRKGINESKISVIQNGVDYGLFCNARNKGYFRKEFSINKPDTIIALIGHLGVEKGHIFFLESAKIILENNHAISFIIVGDGYMMDELIHKTREIGIEEHVIFTGFRNDMPNIMSSIDILVLPSINEGMPMVILEAMSASKPVVATNVGGIPEMIVDGKTGYLVPPCDVNRLAEAVIRLLNDPEKLKDFGNEGLKRVMMCFSANQMASKTQDLFESLILNAN
jgi:glycosyltransferase involved in cell wall biosynthesis